MKNLISIQSSLSILTLLFYQCEANRFYPNSFEGLAINLTDNTIKTPVMKKSIFVSHIGSSSAIIPAVSENGIVYGARTSSGIRAYRFDKSSFTEIWRASPDVLWKINPLLSPDGTVVIIGGSSGVYCFNSTTGSLLWQYNLTVGSTFFPPTQAVFSNDGANIIISAEGPNAAGRCWCVDGFSTFSTIGSVHFVRVQDGLKLWSFTPSWPCPPFGPYDNCGIPANFALPLGGATLGAAQTSSTKVLVTLMKFEKLSFWGNNPNQWPVIFSGRKGGVVALDSSSGAILWEKELPEGSTTPLYPWPNDPSRVIVVSFNEVYALTDTGTQVWMASLNGQIIHLIVSTTSVFVYSNSFVLTALRLADGVVLWSKPFVAFVFGPMLLAAKSDLVCVTASQVIVLNSTSGSTLWSVDKLSSYSFAAAASIDKSGNLYVPTTSGEYSIISKCSPGFFCPSISLELPCPAGTFSIGNAESCTPCPANSYNPSGYATSLNACRACPTGTSSVFGSVACDWIIRQFEPFNQTSCPMKLFPSADLAGDRLDTFISPTEDNCAGACCGHFNCSGYSYTHIGGVSQTCTLLSNVSFVIPSSTMSGGVRTSVLGL